MKGWALLDAVCEGIICAGSMPLMRDREGQVRNLPSFFLRFLLSFFLSFFLLSSLPPCLPFHSFYFSLTSFLLSFPVSFFPSFILFTFQLYCPSPLLPLRSFPTYLIFTYLIHFIFLQIHCVSCGFLKDKDGKIISVGSESLTASKSLPIISTSTSTSSSSTVINKKRKDPVLSRMDSDDEDDEDAEDSMAFSKYVQSRLSQEPDPKTTSTTLKTRSQGLFPGKGMSYAVNQSTKSNENSAEKVYSIIMQVNS